MSATEEGFRTHQAQVAGEKWSLAGEAGARAARNLLLGVCKRPAVLHGAAPPRGFIWSGEGSPGLPLWDGTTHTVIQWEREWIKKTEAEEEKNSLQVIKISQVIALYFPPTDPGGPRDRLCDVAADRKQMRHNEQQHPQIYIFLCYHSGWDNMLFSRLDSSTIYFCFLGGGGGGADSI